MPSTFSPSLRLELIANGEQAGNWGATTNTNLGTLIESAIAGFATISVVSAAQALSYNNGAADESRNAAIKLTTTTGAAFAVYAPPASKTYIVWNASAYAATIYNSTVIGGTTAAGTGVVVDAGRKAVILSDGTNFYAADLATTVTVPQGGTGATTLTGILKGNGASPFTAVPAPTGDVVGTTDAQTLTNKTLTAPTVSSPSISNPLFSTGVRETYAAVAASNIDVSAASVFSKTIAAATTFTVSNVPAAGQAAAFLLELTNGGAFAVTWWSGVKWASGSGPVLTSAGVDILGFYTRDGGTTWRGVVLAKDSK